MPERADGDGLAAIAVPPSPPVHQPEQLRTRRKEPYSSCRPVSEPEAEVEFEVRDPGYQRPIRNRRTPSYLKDFAYRVVYRQRC